MANKRADGEGTVRKRPDGRWYPDSFRENRLELLDDQRNFIE